MNKRFRVRDLDQLFLLPPSLQKWLPERDLARFVGDVANELDLAADQHPDHDSIASSRQEHRVLLHVREVKLRWEVVGTF